MRVTITKPNVFSSYGILMPVGSIQTVENAYGASLVAALQATDTDGVLLAPQNKPYDSAPTQLSGIFTFATLPSAASALQGTIAYTTDQGLCVSGGTTWVSQSTPSTVSSAISVAQKSIIGGLRAITVGDSHLSLGFFQVQVATTAGSVVVGANGVVTVSAGSNTYAMPGSWMCIYNINDPTFSLPFNGVTVKVTAVLSNTSFQFNGALNGVVPAPGDYSSNQGGAWTLYSLNRGTDSSLVKYLNFRAGNPFNLTANYAISGGLTSYQVTLLKQGKILGGPRFDAAFVDGGSNDVGGGGTATLQSALAGAQDAYTNLVTICNAILAYGARVFLFTGVPQPIGVTNASFKNLALNQLRQWLSQYAQVTPGITLLDTWGASLDGTVAGGSMIANYAHTANDVHFSSYANYAIGGQLASVLTNSLRPAVEIGNISVLDDATTYAQLITAWAATTAYTVTTGPALYVINAGNIYKLVTSGTSGSTGPSGVGSSITDGGCVWAFNAVDATNLVQNGAMAGTTGTNNASSVVTGNVPTAWQLFNPVNVSNTSTTTPAQALTGVTGTNKGKWGFGWNLSLVFSAAGSIQANSNDWGSAWRSASATFGGGWFRAGITVQAITASPAVLQQFELQVINNAGAGYAEISEGLNGNNTTTLPLLTTDNPMEMVTPAFYVQPGITSNQAQMYLNIVSSAAGTVPLQISGAWCHRVIDQQS